MKTQNPKQLIFIASFLCSLLTCIISSVIWMAISGVNWLGILVLDFAFIVNACLCGIMATFIYCMFSRLPVSMMLYLGNIIPFGVFLLVSFCMATPDVSAWYLLFLIGWLVMSIIPVAVTSYIVNKKLNAWEMKRMGQDS